MTYRSLLAAAVALAGAAAGWAQSPPEESTRALWDSAFIRQRPVTRPAQVAPALPESERAPSLRGALLGLTVWRLRASTALDEPGARVFVHGEKGDESWMPERVSADLPLAEGQRFRFGIESARSGYLYVIDREEYADGSRGDPLLIFPTTALRGGKNRVGAGTVIELPSWDDNPPYMWLKKSRPDHVAELLTILVTPRPLDEIRLGPQPTPVTAAQLSAWEKRWGAEVMRLDSKSSAGMPYTISEKAAAGGQPLTQDDPTPQTLFLVKPGADETVLINVPLRIRK
jgi:hypothetical protein